MKRRSVTSYSIMIGTALAAVICLSGCGSAVEGAATADTARTAADSTSDTAASTSTPAITTPTDESADESSSLDTTTGTESESSTSESNSIGADPSDSDSSSASSTETEVTTPRASTSPGADGTVDAASARWLSTFCTGYDDMSQYSQPDTNGMGKVQTITTVADAYEKIAGAAAKVKGKLSALPDPSFENGTSFAAGVEQWLGDVDAVYGQGSQTIRKTSFDTPGELKAAIDKIENKINSASQTLSTTLGDVDVSVQTTMLSMPECSTLINGK